jgi:diguanylate cyclase (GGDEF)-like protein/PAS domain S-box-containing protein
VILRVKPELFLFPYIQHWPTASPSGETLLVRRDGDSVLYLNELRHRSGSSQSLHMPMTRTEVPAVVAVNASRPGRIQGNDYRGVPVLAAYRPVTGTDWVILAKLDRDEVLAPLRDLTFWVSLITMLAVSAVGALMLLLWHRRGRSLQLEMQAQSDRLMRQFYDLPFVGISVRMMHSECWNQVNDRMCEIFGYTREEMLRLPWKQLSHPDDVSVSQDELERIERGEIDGFRLEKRYIRKDSTTVYVSVDVKCVRKADGSPDYLISAIQDISERKADEARFQRLTRIYAALSECNQAIVRCTGEEELFPKICRSAVEYGGMKMAWIGRIDPETRLLRPAAWFGEGTDVLQDIVISADAESPYGQGAAGIAIRELRPCWIQDYLNDPITAPWHGHGERYGWRASAVLPLVQNEVATGAFVLLSGETEAFDEVVRNLLAEMAVDISFALTTFTREEERKRAEAQVERLSRIYAALSECNQAIVRCSSAEELFPKICRFAVEFGGMKMAWIGWIDPDTHLIRPAASFGEGAEVLLRDMIVSIDAESPYGQGATGRAVRGLAPVWVQDNLNDPITSPWRRQGKHFGWRGTATLPLTRGGVAVGVLILLAGETDAFDEAVRNLLVEMAMDISFALDLFSKEAERRHMEAALRESESRFRDLYEKAPLPYQSLDSAGNILEVNEAWLNLLGRTRDEVIGRFIGDFMTDVSIMTLENELPKFRQKGRADGVLFQFVHKDGSQRLLMVNGQIARDKEGNFLRAHSIMTDLTERLKTEEQLKLAAKVFEQSAEGVIITGADGNILMVNRAFSAITGYSDSEALGQNPRLLSSGYHDANFYQAMWETVHTVGYWHGEMWNRRKGGEIFPELVSISQVLDADGKVSHYVGIFSDISEHKETQAHIQRLAHYDSLTGLPNRSLLADRVGQSLSRVERNSEPLALVFLDLDRFKNVNDSLGHRIGDELLIQVADRLKQTLRDEDTVSRLGGDEFIMVLPGASASGAAHVAEKVLKALSRPYCIEKHELTITPSLGIAMYPSDGDNYETLSMCADAAMYRAKQGGRNTFRFFTKEMQERSDRTLQLENALHRVLELEQLQLHYQPQIALKDGRVRVIGVEALLRWQHPDLGRVAPSDFIPVAEDSGLILPIGEWVLREAVRQMKAWMNDGMAPMVMAVNLSAVQFRQANLPELVSRILNEFKLPSHCLELELTEGVAMDNPLAAIAVMDDLFQRGIRLSIDDFGTGYSSLSYLKRFKVYKLKIDQPFVRDISTDPEDAAIVEAIINMSKSLGMQTIAEGVETAEQLVFLRKKGCDEVQGYFYAKPMPAQEFESFVKKFDPAG